MNPPSPNLSTRLNQELSRLYFLADSNNELLIGAGGMVRALVIELRLPADWKVLSAVWYGVQTELNWPAPGIAVSGTDGIQLWCSLAEPMDVDHAIDLLSKLRGRFLESVLPERLRMFPSGNSACDSLHCHPILIPASQKSSGNWSAFVSQDLAGIFADEPWLDLPPNPGQQADILSKLKSIDADQLRAALNTLKSHRETGEKMQGVNFGRGRTASSENEAASHLTGITTLKQTPKDFLFWAMNNPKNSLKDRIEAAKALLPYSD